MSNPRLIARNIGINGISQIIIAAIGFIFLIYAARYLGPAEFGNYNFALSFTALLVFIADIGLPQLMVRDLARDKDLVGEYVANAGLIKIFLSFISFVLMVVVINLMGYPQEVKIIVYLFGIYTLISSFAHLLNSVFQAFEKMEYVSLPMLIEKVIIVGFGLLLFYWGYGLIEIAYVYIVACIIKLVYSIYLLITKIPRAVYKLRISAFKGMILESIPFGLNSIFATLFFKIDAILLSFLKNDFAVGIYTAAYNPLLSLSAISTGIIVPAIYPAMSKLFVTSQDSLEKLTLFSSKYMIIIGLPLGIGFFVLSNEFIQMFYGNAYIDAIIVFQILSLFIPIRFLNSLLGTLLPSMDKQISRTLIVGLSALFNVVINLILIPYLSYVGAAISTVLSEIFIYILYVILISRHLKNLKIHSNFLKPIISVLIMALVVFYLKAINLYIAIIIGIVTYLTVLIILKTFNEEDREIFNNIISSRRD